MDIKLGGKNGKDSIDHKQEIKSLGTFKTKVNLHTDVQAELSIKIAAAEVIQ